METRRARRESADLGSVVARSEGVDIRRGGGLGTRERLSLAGLGDTRVPILLDGVPLVFSGHPFGLSNVPVDAVQRVAVYRGVVPIRLGADALGGAIELVTDDDVSRPRLAGSYQLGSFGSRRISAAGLQPFGQSGVFARVSAFADHADNDYPADVEISDASGRQATRRLPRFHDAYDGRGARATVGLRQQSFAERLELQLHYTEHEREVQHNIGATVPYGEVGFDKRSIGGRARYTHRPGASTRLDLTLALSRIETGYRDLSACRYDWYGRCVTERLQAGETASVPIDQQVFQHAVVSRNHFSQELGRGHALRLSLSPTYQRQVGENRALPPEDHDALNARRELVTMVSGVEYEASALHGRLSNIAFAKHYAFAAQSDEALPSGLVRPLSRDVQHIGGGDSLRLQVTPWLRVKASYEYATRLPSIQELFGDGALIVANLRLSPEVSHNVNLSAELHGLRTPLGSVGLGVLGLVREVDRMIVQLGNGSYLQHQNVLSARVWGLQSSLGYSTPGRVLELSGNLSYQDMRNRSDGGALARFSGSRIPNRPYLSGYAEARLRAKGVARESDELSLTYRARYVHEFFLGWQGAGQRDIKLRVPGQLLHSAVLALWLPGKVALSVSAEVDNLTDARAFDFYGVPQPGRAFYLKTTFDL